MLNSKTKTKYALKCKHHYPWSYWNHRSEYHRWKYCHGHLQNDGGVLVESVWIFHSLDEFLCNQIQGIGPVWRDIFLHGPSDSERNNDNFIFTGWILTIREKKIAGCNLTKKFDDFILKREPLLVPTSVSGCKICRYKCAPNFFSCQIITSVCNSSREKKLPFYNLTILRGLV
jgi:hypothetical protein